MKKWLQVVLGSFLIFSAGNAVLAQDHVLMTEFVVTPTEGEFVEFFNPTADTIDLSNYYISDATYAKGGTYYYNIVLGNGGGGGFGDFNARFPDGAKIAPGEHQTLSLNGSTNFFGQYGVTPTYELYEDDAAPDSIPDMREATPGSINNQGGLSNSGEMLILYYWDGTSNLVKDVDYVVWGDKAEAVDKTGVTVNGETYQDDLPIADQSVVNADNDDDPNPHDDGMSAQRRLDVEDLETWTNGNGITGHNEMSENTSWKGGIWSINEPPTPGRRALTPYAPEDSLTIADVQFVRADDIGENVNDDSPFVGDTLTITGIMMQGPREIFLGNRWGGFVQDPRGGPWSGFFIIQHDTSSSGVEGTLITAANPGDIIRVTGVLAEYPTNPNTPSITQFALITDPVTPIEFVDFDQPLPDPILLVPGDLGLTAAGNSADPKLSERWEGTLVHFNNLTVRANGLPGNTLTAGDETGTIVLDDYFNAVSIPVSNNGGVWPGLPAGTKINVTGFVRGGSSTGLVTINPRSLADVEVASAPPEISNITRDPVVPTSSDDVTISATIIDAATVVASAEVWYRVNSTGDFTSVAMTAGADSVFSGIIPAQANGAFVEYFLTAADDEGASTTAPGDTSASKFFYFVRDEGLKIKDIQFVPNPTVSDASSFVGLEVTVKGIVTTDTTDFSFYWIQDAAEAWSGIWINDNVNQVIPGDEVEITGTVEERFGATRINNVTSVNVLSSGNPVPAPVLVKTGDLATGTTSGESWEGVLVRVQNVGVTNPRPDGFPGFGEIVVDDGSGGVRVDDMGNLEVQTPRSGSAITDTAFVEGDSLKSITGIQHYTFGNFKIEPRNTNDLVRTPTGVKGNAYGPFTFALEQNYPNPFNPETTIKYQLAKQGQVSITVFDVLGRKVKTLVDKVQSAGTYHIQWDGTNDSGRQVSTGVYFYKMKTKGFQRVQKMLLMK